jgi:FMN phosphatase YigB (HAD superfamily)
MIKLFVFDLGNVILPFDHRVIALRLQERSGMPLSSSPDELFSFLFDWDEGLVNAYEEGRISSLEFFTTLKRRYRLVLDYEEFTRIWNPIFRDDPLVNALILSLKRKGYPLFLLSNTNELHFAHIGECYPIVHEMDEWILSFEVGAKKPSSRIYDAIFERADVRPEEVFYIDDMEGYVKAAMERGMDGVVFRNAEQLEQVLAEKGILSDGEEPERACRREKER